MCHGHKIYLSEIAKIRKECCLDFRTFCKCRVRADNSDADFNILFKCQYSPWGGVDISIFSTFFHFSLLQFCVSESIYTKLLFRYIIVYILCIYTKNICLLVFVYEQNYLDILLFLFIESHLFIFYIISYMNLD